MSKKITARPTPVEEVEEEEVVEVKEEVKEDKKETKKEEPKKEKPKKTNRKRVQTIDIEPNELIAVRSVTKGLLIYVSSRTGQTVRWSDFGSVEYVEFGELVTMRSANPKFINEPYIAIDDEEVVEKLGLKDLYDSMIDVDNIEDFFSNSLDRMKELIEQMPKGNKKLIGDTAHEMIKDGKLYDIRKIKLLEEELGIGLQIAMD